MFGLARLLQIRKREARIQHLQREIDKIKAKEKEMEELSAGQASTLVRWGGWEVLGF